MAAPVLEARGVTKRYGRVQALQGADFIAYPGEVTALIGDNGAGKSTLVKLLAGVTRPDGGEITINGAVVHLASPADARRHGIETVYQDLALAPDLDAAANLHLGREIYLIRFLRVLDRRIMRERAIAAFAELGIELPDVRAPVAALSGGQRQSVAVARAVAYASRIIFMDEPTAALGVVQRARVLDTIRRVRDRGIAVVLISHNMPEVLAIADRIQVLRLGRRVATFSADQASVEDLVGAMTGALEINGGARHAGASHESAVLDDGDQASAGPEHGGHASAGPDNAGPDGGGQASAGPDDAGQAGAGPDNAGDAP